MSLRDESGCDVIKTLMTSQTEIVAFDGGGVERDEKIFARASKLTNSDTRRTNNHRLRVVILHVMMTSSARDFSTHQKSFEDESGNRNVDLIFVAIIRSRHPTFVQHRWTEHPTEHCHGNHR